MYLSPTQIVRTKQVERAHIFTTNKLNCGSINQTAASKILRLLGENFPGVLV